MAVKKSNQKSATKKKKKTNFLSCNGCMGRFPAANVFQAPANKHGLKLVCQSCFKQYIGSHMPVPSASSKALKDKHGAFITNANAGILSNANAGFMGLNTGTFMGKNTGTFISDQGAGLISNHSGKFISDNGAGLIEDAGAYGIIHSNTGNLISDNGAALIGKIR